jgi:hypothetical protein
MNTIRTVAGCTFFVAYGWLSYVAYYSRPEFLQPKIRELDWKVHLDPDEKNVRELEDWEEWRRLPFSTKLVVGPPRRHH